MKLLPCCVAAVVSVLLPACAAKPVALTRAGAIATIYRTVSVGDEENHAIARLERLAFRCRRLASSEYASSAPEPVKAIQCYTEANRTAEGYALVYASLSANRSGRLTQVHADWYPVAFRSLRTDSHGRTVVMQDPAEVHPLAAKDNLQGRWTISAVNGRKVSGLWLDLGGEGPASITRSGSAVHVASPRPPTRAFLGCNDWHPSGWTLNGDKLKLGTEMSLRTERGCDAATMALDDAVYAIFTQTMTMEFTPPNRLRLVNEKGTLDLVRGEN